MQYNFLYMFILNKITLESSLIHTYIILFRNTTKLCDLWYK